MNKSEKYLVEDEQREVKAVQYFSQFALSKVLSQFSQFQDGNWWAIQNFQKSRVGAEGDIDLLIGRYTFEEGRPVPNCETIIGIEAKCLYRNLEDPQESGDFKSAKQGPGKERRVHGQLKWLTKSGFDWILLLEIIANPPMYATTDSGISAWFAASNLAYDSTQKALDQLRRDLPGLDHVGHLCMSIGAVAGGNESIRGSHGPPQIIREPKENPQNMEFRVKLAESIHKATPPRNLEDVASHIVPRFFFDSGGAMFEDRTYMVFGVPIQAFPKETH